ncbi:hypothetical protein F8M41_002812 [Gigaspora margarita]|uniref:Uncharacterized protein n=1 Tax=Gigaspora margarita TaxID=4874 RepID=A0A8H4AYK5_GIGMA|nr:hypothetical protein F8M41_002812 [Gigaspora margarita]
MNLTPPRPAKVTPPRSAKVMPPRSASNNRKDGYDDSTYDPLEDDDYNVDEGRPLDNFSEENSEWCEEMISMITIWIEF